MERDSCSRIRCLSQSTRKRGCELRFGESPSLCSLCLWDRRCCSSLNTSAARRWCKFGNSFGPARSTRLRLALSADIRTETERERKRFMQEGNRRTNHQFLSWFCGVWLFWFLGVCRQRLGGRGPATEDSGTPDRYSNKHHQQATPWQKGRGPATEDSGIPDVLIPNLINPS